MSKHIELVITRGVGESIVIGDPRSPVARVTVQGIAGSDRVNLSVQGDPSLPVHRAEVAAQIANDEDDPLGGATLRR